MKRESRRSARRLLRQATARDLEARALDIEAARGGLRDIEAAAEFLQLLAGGDRPDVRKLGTLDTIAALEQASVLTVSQRTLLEDAYVYLPACCTACRSCSDHRPLRCRPTRQNSIVWPTR